ncbi:unnamed protein product [Pieris macdunnoughi]|uniref:Ig-like domain-containing protein n=1 Tax=Pieris macdunnoughi TaxID=345717 RepID=A0A821SB26_9NEOP|nr:unnamed protein product [Pieris macdunnoughi]
MLVGYFWYFFPPLVRSGPGSPSSSVTGTVTRVSSVVGGEAELPCDSRPPQRNDSLLLVVWYRDDNPVYRYVINMLF